jgi:uncharacterized damage-inducible protein DinB
MTIGESMLEEFDSETGTTRRVLERVPSDKGQWKPHPKSFAVGHLAQLIAWMPGWVTAALKSSSLDLAAHQGYSFEKTETLLDVFDKNVREARQALATASDAAFSAPWSLRRGEQVFFTVPVGVIVRQNINHLVHHRGQMTVYLRLLDIPVPSIYGPTADEAMPTREARGQKPDA